MLTWKASKRRPATKTTRAGGSAPSESVLGSRTRANACRSARPTFVCRHVVAWRTTSARTSFSASSVTASTLASSSFTSPPSPRPTGRFSKSLAAASARSPWLLKVFATRSREHPSVRCASVSSAYRTSSNVASRAVGAPFAKRGTSAVSPSHLRRSLTAATSVQFAEPVTNTRRIRQSSTVSISASLTSREWAATSLSTLCKNEAGRVFGATTVSQALPLLASTRAATASDPATRSNRALWRAQCAGRVPS
mmetsp:Transcript_2565/g.7388  ORF Transcript_2565/g.7388 Transcript_2565/m.7388 type:complete len:252 (+) Transcript_2565:1791-2546(+)